MEVAAAEDLSFRPCGRAASRVRKDRLGHRAVVASLSRRKCSRVGTGLDGYSGDWKVSTRLEETSFQPGEAYQVRVWKIEAFSLVGGRYS